MCLYLFWESLSVGLRRAKTTEVWAKWYLCPLAIAFRLADRELHERRGEAVRCAAAFYIARFLARSLSSDHSAYPLCLLSDLSAIAFRLFFCTRHVPTSVEVEFHIST